MKQYLDLLRDILDHGAPKADRTGVGTLSVFGRQLRFDLREGFPLLTTKRLHFRSIACELLWFISGSTNANDLEKQGVTIWREWTDENGELGPVYGAMWRRWPCEFGDNPRSAILKHFDQLADVIDEIKVNPNSRRLLVSAWNVAEIPDMALPPCHFAFQFNVTDGRLSCHMHQRSADCFLGLPFGIASYALLTHLVAAVTGLVPGDLIISLGDAHLYRNHVSQAQEQLTREPRPLPDLDLVRMPASIDDVRYEDLVLRNYNPHPHIPAPVAV